jgi:hypothetical protein
VLTVWVVREHPPDHPNHYVVRAWHIDGVKPMRPVDNHAELWNNLDNLRGGMVQRGLIRVEQRPGDDPTILEMWV